MVKLQRIKDKEMDLDSAFIISFVTQNFYQGEPC